MIDGGPASGLVIKKSLTTQCFANPLEICLARRGSPMKMLSQMLVGSSGVQYPTALNFKNCKLRWAMQ